MIDAQFPEKLECLFTPKRLKVLYGGRGAGRSWGVARALILTATKAPLRVLCARELQNSITDSVHKLLSDQIEALGLDWFYEVQATRIYGKNGSAFSFEGIKNNYKKIKSYEGIDVCWVEEAVNVSKNSWKVLLPTIRKPGSEIWLTFNPELEEDYTYKRFVKEADPARTSVVHMTYKDNPWFPQELAEDMEYDKKNDYDTYLNVWEGHCLQVLEGVVYAKEIREATIEGRITRVPWHKESPVDTFWDLGRANNTAIWFGQRVGTQYRFIEYLEAQGEDITYFIKELQRKPYLYGEHWLPHDGKAKLLGNKRTIEEQVGAAFKGRVRILPKVSILEGINAGKILFKQAFFDEDKCSDGLHALRHYRYKITPPKSGEVKAGWSKEPLHDWASDGADAFRMAGLSMIQPKAKGSLAEKLLEKSGAFIKNLSATGQAWMGG